MLPVLHVKIWVCWSRGVWLSACKQLHNVFLCSCDKRLVLETEAGSVSHQGVSNKTCFHIAWKKKLWGYCRHLETGPNCFIYRLLVHQIQIKINPRVTPSWGGHRHTSDKTDELTLSEWAKSSVATFLSPEQGLDCCTLKHEIRGIRRIMLQHSRRCDVTIR